MYQTSLQNIQMQEDEIVLCMSEFLLFRGLEENNYELIKYLQETRDLDIMSTLLWPCLSSERSELLATMICSCGSTN